MAADAGVRPARTPATGERRRNTSGWTGLADLRAHIRRLWDRGALPRAVVTGESTFPMRLPLKVPATAELDTRFDAVRAWIAELREEPRIRLEWREVKHRVLGANAVPAAAWVDSLEAALQLAGRQRDAARLATLTADTRRRLPALVDYVAAKPLRALEYAEPWGRLIAVAEWLSAHTRPGLYLRQIDLPSIDSKFIESHRGVLAELFEHLLPASAIDPTATGASGFARRFGFLDKPERIRFRILDAERGLLPGTGLQDVTVDAATFAALDPAVAHVFITENEVNFLAFPPARDSLVLFGGGYGFDALREVRWLESRRLHYWGDIDTHGFAILDQLRAQFPRVESFLMDRETLLAHEASWGEESQPVRRDLPRLTREERRLYDDLRDERIRPRLRLEQERIGFGHVANAVMRITGEQADKT